MKRLGTGIPNLDAILGGGLPAASINLIAGQPGTGKTMLVQQIVYAMATPERPALYLSTVNEPLHKILRFVQSMSFFDERKVGTAIRYEDIGGLLAKGSVEEVLGFVEQRILRDQPAIVVIDSFRALAALSPDPVVFRRALYRLAGTLTAAGSTAFFVGEYGPTELLTAPEGAIADGILELTNERRGIRTYRYLSVVKLRGSGFIDGQHAVRLTRDGVVLFPRFTTPPRPAGYESADGRGSFGVPDLDAMVAGGPFTGSSTLVTGPTGSGKTLLALSFAFEAARRGKTVVMVAYGEDPDQLGRIAANFGWDLPAALKEGHLRLLYASPVEIDIDEQVLRLTEEIRNAGATHVVIDSLSDLHASAFDDPRFFNYLFSLIQHFKDARITALLTVETGGMREGEVTARGVSRIADNVVTFHRRVDKGRIASEVAVLKSRGGPHDAEVRPYRITSQGLRVEGSPRPGAPAPAKPRRRPAAKAAKRRR